MKLSSLAGPPYGLPKGSGTLHRTKVYIPLIILSLSDSDYPTVPIKFGYTGSWRRVITPIHTDTTVYAVYTAVGGGGGGGGEIIIPPQPTSPGEIMSGGEGEPVEADVPAEDETVSPQGTHVTGTQTVTHEYLTLNGKVARETIRTNNTLTAVLDFIYDESGKPFALKYSTNGTSFQTYYYVLNLQGDVVKLIHYIPGFEYESVATYEYDAWGNIVSSSGRLAEINPLRYRGYYYDNETGFYYLQSRYYDPANRRFMNADSLSSTGQGFVGTNMFVYCNNNPVLLLDSAGRYSVSATTNISNVDEKSGKIEYKTVITEDARYDFLGFIPLGSVESYEFIYEVNKEGVISLDNRQKNAKYLAKGNEGAVRLTLAAEMMRVAKEQVPGALEGRTVFGIQTELALHYTAYVLHIKRSSSTKADIGSSKPGAIGYDSNADYFEHPFKHIKDIVNMLL